MRSTRIATLLVCTAAAAGAQAADYTLDFNGNICGAAGNVACGNGSDIGQNYGDVPGMLDIAHRSVLVSSGATFENHLKFWAASYSNLSNVAWGGANQVDYISEIRFTPTSGNVVSLRSFDFGDYQDRNFGSSATIRDAGTQQLLWSSGAFNPGATATSFAPVVASSSGLVLRWGPDAYDVGIDNIKLSVSPIPETGTAALLLAGLGLLATRLRRRSR